MRSLSKFACLTILLWGSATSVRADLHFQEPIVELGQVRSGPTLAHSFRFVNQGEAPVEITDLRASCGCLKPKLDKKIYQPGEEGTLPVEINTLTQPAGPNAWRVEIICKKGEGFQEIPLILRAQLVRQITIEPAAMTIYADREIQHEITLTDLRPRKPLAITRLVGSSPKLKATVKEKFLTPLGQLIYKIQLEVPADYPEGKAEETLGIYTDDEDYRELRVPVTVIKKPRLQVTATPGEVDLKIPKGQTAAARVVLLRGTGKVVVEKVIADDPALTCTFAQGPGEMATVKINVDRNKTQGQNVQTAVKVVVSSPGFQTVVVPVRCGVE